MYKKSRRFRNHRKFHRDNRGSTLLVVILAMLMLGILGTVSLYTTYVNYSIKITERNATNNFYTAEMVMEEIKAGLEKEVSLAFTEAYLEIMQNYGAYDPVQRTVEFQHRYLTSLSGQLASAGRSDQVDLSKLESYISEAQRGASELRLTDESAASLIQYNDSVVIQGLKLTYTNTSGYVAVIATDIVLKIPTILFEEDSALPDVLAYSLIADRELHFDQGGNYQVRGNVYGGKYGIYVKANVAFLPADGSLDHVVATGGNVYVTDSGAKLRLNGESLDGAFSGGASSLWAEGIIVDSAEVSLRGKSYVHDDLTINGKNSIVKLAGAYYGFGYESVSTRQYGPASSSSILINGTKTTLDLSLLTELGLAGQAYIGTTDPSDREAAPGDGTEFASTDVRMGEALSVQSNQLAYLVPPECIGYINGECVLGANPVNLTAYRQYKTAESAAQAQHIPCAEVDLTKVTLGTETVRSLSEYGASWQKVFYQAAGSSNAWVYYYLKFESAQQANAFFADYYEQNRNLLNQYIKVYLDSYKAPAGMQKLNLAGNAVYYDEAAGGFVLEPAGYSGEGVGEGEDPALAALLDYENYTGIYQALNINLTMNYAALTNDQIARDSVFLNIVNVEKLREYLGTGTEKTVTAAGGQKVLLVDNAEGEVYILPDDSSLSAVIATGSVKVTHNFKGMILSGETIYVENAARVESDPDAVSLALQADGGNILSCFWEGADFQVVPTPTPGEGTPEPDGYDEEITTNSLVSYRNWKKS